MFLWGTWWPGCMITATLDPGQESSAAMTEPYPDAVLVLVRGGTKVLFALIRVFSGHPGPDAAKLVFCRPGFCVAQAATQEAKQLSGGMEPGMASQAQPHLDALQ
jgi:hypothetical protein